MMNVVKWTWRAPIAAIVLAFTGSAAFAIESETLVRLVQAATDRSRVFGAGEEKVPVSSQALLRQVLRHGEISVLAVEINGYVSVLTTNEPRLLAAASASEPHRSSRLTRLWHTSEDAVGLSVIDRLAVSRAFGRLRLSIGRQAINWSTVFYFTPNDYFAPFRAESFYRAYKPGVDAALVDYYLGDLTVLSLVHASDFERHDAQTESSEGGSTTMIRFATNVAALDLAVMVGRVLRRTTLGMGLQGQLPLGIGVRAEANYQIDEVAPDEDEGAVTLGFERFLVDDLFLRVEHFYQSAGAAGITSYDQSIERGLLHPARSYTAIGVSYQWTPLIDGQYLLLGNDTDGSALLSAHHGYSVANEADLALTTSSSVGRASDRRGRTTEFAQAPYGVSLSFTSYF